MQGHTKKLHECFCRQNLKLYTVWTDGCTELKSHRVFNFVYFLLLKLKMTSQVLRSSPLQSSSPITARSIYVPPEHFPYFEITILFFGSLTSALPLTGLFPYVGYMVVDLHEAKDIDSAGYMSGYVASAFMIGRLLSSYYWGHVADRIGRKPVIYISCSALFVFSISFGLSKNIFEALISRLFLGLMNPLNTLTKTLISEICSKKHQAMGMSLAAGSWSIGAVVGPAIGGALARPAVQYPNSVLDNDFFRYFPYLLPNIVTALLALLSGLLVFRYLPETMPISVISSSSSSSSEVPDDNSDDDEVSDEMIRNSSYRSTDHMSSSSNHSRSSDAVLVRSESKNTSRRSSPGICRSFIDLLGESKVQRVCAAYFLLSLTSIVYDECMPLWALSSINKGKYVLVRFIKSSQFR